MVRSRGLLEAGRRRQTRGVVLVRKVGAVGRTGDEDAPEGAAVHSGAEAGDVDVPGQAALDEGLAEAPIVNVVVEVGPDEDGQVVVSICWSVSERSILAYDSGSVTDQRGVSENMFDPFLDSPRPGREESVAETCRIRWQSEKECKEER